jgi:glycosyltransferase involved in cell wall biosynthesis
MSATPPVTSAADLDATGAPQTVRVCMHILHSARTDVRALRAGAALRDAGMAVTVVDVEARPSPGIPESWAGVRVEHIAVPESFVTTRFERFAVLRATRLFVRGVLRLLRSDADIYHALDLPAMPATFVAALLRRKPLVFEAYEVPLGTLGELDSAAGRRWLDRLMTPVLPLMLRYCRAVIAVSPPIVEMFRQRYGCRNVWLIRNVPEYRSVTKTDRLRQALGLTAETRIALYQGALQKGRGLDVLVRAACFLDPEIVIVMMGQDEGGVVASLERLISREGVADQVRIIPPVSYGDLLDWTASADLGLILYPPGYSPNIRMMLPNKLFEYLMAGLPVLASELECVVDVVTSFGVGWIVSPLDAEHVGTTINGGLADECARDQMRASALDAARRTFCWDREKEELLRLYGNIAALPMLECRGDAVTMKGCDTAATISPPTSTS